MVSRAPRAEGGLKGSSSISREDLEVCPGCQKRRVLKCIKVALGLNQGQVDFLDRKSLCFCFRRAQINSISLPHPNCLHLHFLCREELQLKHWNHFGTQTWK